MRNLKLLLAACVMLAGNLLYAQYYPPDNYSPIDPPYTGVTGNDCPGSYAAVRTLTNPVNSTIWFEAPASGLALFTDVSDYTNETRIVSLRRRDFLPNCHDQRQLGIYVHAGDEYKIQFYYKTSAPAEPAMLNIIWPSVRLDIVSLKPEDETPSQVVHRIFTPETNQQYQLFYTQTNGPGITSWIPHQWWVGKFTPFLLTNSAHMTSNRPHGFWALWKGGSTHFDTATNIAEEDVDEPIGYPPPLACTNNCSTNITPPGALSP